MEAVPERSYILTLGEDILKTIDEKESKSFVAPVKPRSKRAGGRGSPTNDNQAHSAGEGPPASQVIGSRDPLPDETRDSNPERPKGKDTAGVPTTLEGLFSTGEEKSAHEVLGLLVDSHIKEAEAILGRTNLQRHE